MAIVRTSGEALEMLRRRKRETLSLRLSLRENKNWLAGLCVHTKTSCRRERHPVCACGIMGKRKNSAGKYVTSKCVPGKYASGIYGTRIFVTGVNILLENVISEENILLETMSQILGFEKNVMEITNVRCDIDYSVES